MKCKWKCICFLISSFILFSACGIEIVSEDDLTEDNIIGGNVTEDTTIEDTTTEDTIINNVVDTEDISEMLDDEGFEIFVYEGNLYCGLGMAEALTLETRPDDFEAIGTFQGALTEEKEELTSTMVFETGDVVYHYTDEKGYHYFLVKYKLTDSFMGVCQARIYKNMDNLHISEAHEIVDYKVAFDTTKPAAEADSISEYLSEAVSEEWYVGTYYSDQEQIIIQLCEDSEENENTIWQLLKESGMTIKNWYKICFEECSDL